MSDILERLADVVESRKAGDPESSYVARLFACGEDAMARHGYFVPKSGVLDEATQRVLSSFQMRYRPARYDGQPDAETAALVHVLTTPP